MKYIKVFTATNAYDLQCYVKEYEQNTKHIPVNQSCSVAKIDREREIGYVNCLDWLLIHFDEYLEEEVVLQEQEKAKVLEEKEKQRLAKLRRGV